MMSVMENRVIARPDPFAQTRRWRRVEEVSANQCLQVFAERRVQTQKPRGLEPASDTDQASR